MANVKKSPVQTQNEQTVLNPAVEADVAAGVGQVLENMVNGDKPAEGEVPRGTDTPAEDVTPTPPPAYMLPILAARKEEDDKKAAEIVELDNQLTAANEAYVGVLTAAKFKQTPEVITASAVVKAASDALEAAQKSVELLILEREESDAKLVNKYVLCEAFDIDMARLEAMLVAEAKETVKQAFFSVFGRPVIYAKQGATGKQVVANATKSATDKPAEGGEVAEAGDKWAEAHEALASGKTYDELLQLFPTRPKNGEVNYSKLNGTIRTVISSEGWVKQEDGRYAKA